LRAFASRSSATDQLASTAARRASTTSSGSSSTVSMTPRTPMRPSSRGGATSMSPAISPASSRDSATICASTARLMRIAGGERRVTLSVAAMLPRRQRCDRAARNCGSSGSKPEGRRSRNSSERPLTLRNSQIHEMPSASPSLRAKPVMLETTTAPVLRRWFRGCRGAVIAAAAEGNNAGVRGRGAVLSNRVPFLPQIVIPGRRAAASPESIFQRPVFMDSGPRLRRSRNDVLRDRQPAGRVG
jgi:hypothetical protein